jgi:hypothetical protein
MSSSVNTKVEKRPSFEDVLRLKKMDTKGFVYDPVKCESQKTAITDPEEQRRVFYRARDRLGPNTFQYYFVDVPGATFHSAGLVDKANTNHLD